MSNMAAKCVSLLATVGMASVQAMDVPDLNCQECVEFTVCFANGEFSPSVDASPHCEGAEHCGPCFVPEDDSEDDDSEDDSCTCYASCEESPDDCPALENVLTDGGCADKCNDSIEVYEGCIEEYYVMMECTFDPFFTPPTVFSMEVELTFAEELEDDEIVTVTTAIQEDVATDLGVESDTVEVIMSLQSGGSSRHLLSFVYETSITITLPASVAVEIVESVETTVSNPDTIEDSVASIPELAEVNGGAAPTAIVTLFSVSTPDGDFEETSFTKSPTPAPTVPETPSDASQASSTFGLLVAIACIVHAL